MLKYVFSILLLIFISQPTLMFADDHEDLISGVINAISIDDNGNVEGILLMMNDGDFVNIDIKSGCLLYTSPSPRDLSTSRMPSSA